MRRSRRLLAAPLLTAVVAAVLVPTAAFAEQYGKRSKDGDGRSRQYRSSTELRNGLCVRDNGRRLDSLNLNHRCDREEFWNRIRDRDGIRN